jgi:hypothetical protein
LYVNSNLTSSGGFGNYFKTTGIGNTDLGNGNQVIGLYSQMASGYTGNSGTTAMMFMNLASGIGTNPYPGTGRANFGMLGDARGQTSGTNVGAQMQALNGKKNYGAMIDAVNNLNNPTDNIGVIGFALNATNNVGGYFGLLQNIEPTFESSALIADNGTTTSPIFLARDNGMTVFSIIDGGNVGIGTTAPTEALYVTGNIYATGDITCGGTCGGGGGSSPIEIVNSTNLFSTSIGAGGNYSSSGSIFLGSHAGESAFDASDSNMFGTYAGYAAYHASSSNFFGSSAGSDAYDAVYSNFFGTNAGSGSAEAYYSNFFGSSAGNQALYASYSNFIGTSAGASAYNSSNSNFMGMNAGNNASDANNSNFFGYNAGNQASYASYSNFIGSQAGYQAANAPNSIFIGNSAGLNDTVDNFATGGTSILIGDHTNTGGYSDSIALGAYGINTMSNQFLVAPAYNNWQIAGVDYVMPSAQGGVGTILTNNGSGVLSWGAATNSSYIPYTGGTSNIDIGIHNFTADTNSLFVDSVNHRVGVGTITPGQQLEITKNFRFPNTTRNGGSPFGIIYKDTTPFIHNFNYGNNGTVTTDGSNTFMGIGSGNLTMGITAIVNYQSSYNSGYGSNTLTANTVGYSNTAIGVNTLTANTIGNNNTATGVWSLATNTIGIENTSNGVDTLFNNLDGSDNTAVGAGALYTNTSGSYNTSVGAFSLNTSTTASYNVALGYNSGTYIANGVAKNITGNNSLFLGAFTRALADAQTNQIVIGYGAIGNGSNSITLGNTSITKTILTGSVGIGNTIPSYTLQVGNNTVAGIVARFENSTGTCDINPTTSTLSCSSDINLKKNITDLNNIEYNLKIIDTTNLSTLDKVLTLTPVTYNWKSELDTDPKHIGFIAQEMEQVFPNLVSTDINTGLKSISYATITPYLVKAIEEMDLKVKDLSSLDTSSVTSLGYLIKSLLADVGNNITDLYASVIHGDRVETKTLCVGSTCVTEEQFLKMVNNSATVINNPVVDTTTSPVVTPDHNTSVTPPSVDDSKTTNNEITTPPIDSSSNTSTPPETPAL